jgi:hypothetical protein
VLHLTPSSTNLTEYVKCQIPNSKAPTWQLTRRCQNKSLSCLSLGSKHKDSTEQGFKDVILKKRKQSHLPQYHTGLIKPSIRRSFSLSPSFSLYTHRVRDRQTHSSPRQSLHSSKHFICPLQHSRPGRKTVDKTGLSVSLLQLGDL